jgi:S-adenosylhomocysteine hydrolase
MTSLHLQQFKKLGLTATIATANILSTCDTAAAFRKQVGSFMGRHVPSN